MMNWKSSLLWTLGGLLLIPSAYAADPSTFLSFIPKLMGKLQLNSDCTPEETEKLTQGIAYGRIMVDSPAFRECVETAFRKGFDGVGPYRACKTDPFATASLEEQIRKALEASRSPNPLSIKCSGAPNDVLAWTPFVYPAGVSPESEYHVWNRAALNNAPLDLVAEMVWHEALHARGYQHGFGNDNTNSGSRIACGYQATDTTWNFRQNSIPYIVDHCMGYVVRQTKKACGASELKECSDQNLAMLSTSETKECACTLSYTPAQCETIKAGRAKVMAKYQQELSAFLKIESDPRVVEAKKKAKERTGILINYAINILSEFTEQDKKMFQDRVKSESAWTRAREVSEWATQKFFSKPVDLVPGDEKVWVGVGLTYYPYSRSTPLQMCLIRTEDDSKKQKANLHAAMAKNRSYDYMISGPIHYAFEDSFDSCLTFSPSMLSIKPKEIYQQLTGLYLSKYLSKFGLYELPEKPEEPTLAFLPKECRNSSADDKKNSDNALKNISLPGSFRKGVDDGSARDVR